MCNTDMAFSNFRIICATTWKDIRGLVIEKDSDLERERYRIGFDRTVTDCRSLKGVILATNAIEHDFVQNE